MLRYYNILPKQLSLLVSSEFFNEGDLEKEKFKQEPIVNFYFFKPFIQSIYFVKHLYYSLKDAMNRNKSDQLPKAQIQFLQSVAVPLYHVRNHQFFNVYTVFKVNNTNNCFQGLTVCNPLLKQLSDTCDENIKEWEKLDKELKLL